MHQSDIFVNGVIEDTLPEVITNPMLCTATDRDTAQDGIVVNRVCGNSLSKYHQIFHDLSYIYGVIDRRKSILVSKSLQADCATVTHESQ